MIIGVQGLEFDALIGVYAHEKNQKQKLSADFLLEISDEKSCKSDEVSHTYDYDKIQKIIDASLKDHVNLIEALAYKILQEIMQDSLIDQATIRLYKNAIPTAKNVFVELSLKR